MIEANNFGEQEFGAVHQEPEQDIIQFKKYVSMKKIPKCSNQIKYGLENMYEHIFGCLELHISEFNLQGKNVFYSDKGKIKN